MTKKKGKPVTDIPEEDKPSDDAPGDGEEDFPSAEPQPDAVAFGMQADLHEVSTISAIIVFSATTVWMASWFPTRTLGL